MTRWLLRLVAGCDPEEARTALRLYWREHRRRMLAIIYGEAAVLFGLTVLSSYFKAPRLVYSVGVLTKALDYLGEVKDEQYLYPYALIPLVVIAVMLVVPRGLSHPPPFSMRALEWPYRFEAGMLAICANAGYLASLFMYSRVGQALPLAWGWTWGIGRDVASFTLLALFVCIPPLVLLSLLNIRRLATPAFVTGAAVWALCHLLWNAVYWPPLGLDLDYLDLYFGPAMVPAILVGADMLALCVAVLLWHRRTRLTTFCLACLAYTITNVCGIWLVALVGYPVLYILSLGGVFAMGLPSTLWVVIVGVVK